MFAKYRQNASPVLDLQTTYLWQSCMNVNGFLMYLIIIISYCHSNCYLFLPVEPGKVFFVLLVLWCEQEYRDTAKKQYRYHTSCTGSRDGAVETAHASHQRGLGLIPGPGIVCPACWNQWHLTMTMTMTLKITASQQAMSRQDDNLSTHSFGLPVIFDTNLYFHIFH